MEAYANKRHLPFECELLTLGELETFSVPLANVLNTTSDSIPLVDAAGPHTALVMSYLRHLERAYPRLWIKRIDTPGRMDGTMPGPLSSEPGSPLRPPSPAVGSFSRTSSMSSTDSVAAAAELGSRWLNTYKQAQAAFAQISAATDAAAAADVSTLHELLTWLVGVAPQLKAMIAEGNL